MSRVPRKIGRFRNARKTAPGGDRIRLGPLGGFIGFHLRLAQEASFQAFARRVSGIDLTPGRFAILALIGENPGLSQTALGQACGRDKSSLTPALNDLKRRGLIVRRTVPRDRRSYALSLTEKGERALETLMVHARAHDETLDRIVGLRSKAAVLGALRRIVTALS